MPAEIADSDSDSVCASPQRPPISPINTPDLDARQLDPSEPDPVLDLQFSQFLSPTQRLSSAVQHEQKHNEALPRSSGSTDRFLRDIHQPERDVGASMTASVDTSLIEDGGSSALYKPKRRFSDIEQSTSSPLDLDHRRRKSAKKAKTYGTSRSMRDDAPSSSLEQKPLTTFGGRDEETLSESAEMVQDAAAHYVNARQQMNQPINSLQSHTTFTGVRRKSHNGYHGISLDFRDGRGGSGIDVNPFGSLSQVSLDGEIDSKEIQRFAELFTAQRNIVPAANPEAESTSTKHVDVDEQASHGQKRGASSEAQSGLGEGSSPSTTKQLPLDVAQTETSISVRLGRDASDENASASKVKKRGRKSKNKDKVEAQQANDGPAKAEDSEMTDDQLDPRKHDAHLAHNNEEGDHSGNSTQSKAIKRRKKSTEKRKQADTSPVKNVSSELGLNDPNLIGMPKEVYHAKPSRSRSKRQIDRNNNAEQHETLDMADGLSTAEDVESETVLMAEKTSNTESSRRKGKTKRSKASTKPAGGRVVKHNTLVNDNDDDDRVNQNYGEPPSSLQAPQLESGHLGQRDTQESQDESNAVETVRKAPCHLVDEYRAATKQISIDIPPPPNTIEVEANADPPKAKKRGRKSKKKSTQVIDDTHLKEEAISAENDIEEATETMSDQRPALHEKDLNTMAENVKSPSPKTVPKDILEVDQVDQDEEHDDLEPGKSVKSNVSTPKIPAQTATPTTLIKTSAPLSSTSLFNQRTRIGLSRTMRIPSLLRKLDRTKEAPKIHERKEKLTKKQQEVREKQRLESEDGGDDSAIWTERGADGMLVEWND